MAANVASSVFVRRHSAYNTMNQPVFLFDPSSGRLERQLDGSIRTNGWLVDFEKVISGPKRIIFFQRDNRRYVALDGNVLEFGADIENVSHIRGRLVSTLTLSPVSEPNIYVRYVTPWWRLIFDDGSHPDLHFPLAVFSEQFIRASG